MGKRDRPEVNAGSMADIAFLLLVFFLVTTTINRPETGIRAVVPEVEEQVVLDPENLPPPTPVEPGDLLYIYANKNNNLLIEKTEYEPEDVDQIYDLTLEFYGSHTEAKERGAYDADGDGFDDYPIRWKVTADSVDSRIRGWQDQLDYYLSIDSDKKTIDFYKSMVQKWAQKKRVLDQIGEYYELPDVARIIFETDDETDYGFYLSVLDKVKAAQLKMMDDFCKSRWQVTYSELNPPTEPKIQEKNKDKIEIVKVLYPVDKFYDESEKRLTETKIR